MSLQISWAPIFHDPTRRHHLPIVRLHLTHILLELLEELHQAPDWGLLRRRPFGTMPCNTVPQKNTLAPNCPQSETPYPTQTMIYDVWYMVYDLWYMIYDLHVYFLIPSHLTSFPLCCPPGSIPSLLNLGLCCFTSFLGLLILTLQRLERCWAARQGQLKNKSWESTQITP